MVAQFEAEALRNRALPFLDALVDELLDPAAVNTDDVVVMLAFVKLEYRGSALEVMASDEARPLELGQDAVDRCEPDVLVRLDEATVDVLGAHVARLTAGQYVQDLQAGRRDLEAGAAQLRGFHLCHDLGRPRGGAVPV